MYLSQGTLLQDRYRIDKALGHGGFGVTYVAEDLTLKVQVAVKEYLPLQLATRMGGQTRISVYGGEARDRFDYGLKRFLDEARAVAKFSHHPNIVSVRDFFEANGTAYMVMEYVDGITFHQFLHQQGGRITLAQAKGILFPMMAALQEVHQAGLLHRDISPDNIYLTKSGPVKLLDFGAARYFMGEHSQSLSIILKTGFAPEEQYRPSGRQGAWTDVYALAATFYRAITGVTPPDALDRREGDTLVLPSRMGVAISPEEEKALLKGLAVPAEQRYQSVDEFRQALTVREDAPSRLETTPPSREVGTAPPEIRSEEAPPPPPSSETAPGAPAPPSRTSQSPLLMATLVAVGIVLLGGGGLLWWHFQDSSSGAGQALTPKNQEQVAASPKAASASKSTATPTGKPSSGEKPSEAPGSQVTSEATPAAGPATASAEALLAEGRTLYQEKKYGEAIGKLEEAISLDPAKAEAHYYLGLAYFQFIRYMEAVQSFQQALAAKADYAEAYAGLGMAYYQLDQTQEAIKALEKAINLDDKLNEARYNLALAYLAKDNKEKALQQYQALKTADPEIAQLLNDQLQQAGVVVETPSQAVQPPETVPSAQTPPTPAQPSAAVTPPPQVQPAPAAPTAGEPLWPWTSERLATEAELAALSFRELRLMRNEILARHGWVFRTRDLKAYFNKQPWYRPGGSQKDLVTVNRAIMAELNRIERRNNTLILRHEMRRKFKRR